MGIKVDLTNVDEYIAAQPRLARTVLERVRRTIRKALPECEETLSYRIPTYKLDGRAVIYFAGWKAHYALYPIGKHIVSKFSEELADCEVDKSTIRFPFSKAVPVKLIGRIATMRAQDAAGRRREKRI
jgi:uncharacterized protein YdhG (YjbR/CyaY superfamily)